MPDAIWGAVFDWDGVIFDSSRHHEKSWERLAAESGHRLPPDHFKKGFGMKNEKIIPELLGWTQDPAEIRGLSLRKEELYREVVLEVGIEPLPGVSIWLQRLQDHRVPCVIGSSTHRLNITTILEVMGLGRFFQDMVTAEDVSHGKPDPEVFLKAAARIQRAPARCVVFEDAHVGIQAAGAAGMKVVGVATTHPRGELIGTDLVTERLDTLEIGTLEKILGV